MFYASPSTTVIELGNLHSATYRWEEFKQHASVSGCRYVSFFADLKDVPHYEAVDCNPGRSVLLNRAIGTAKAAGLSDRQKALTALYAERFPMRFKKQMDARG